MHRQHRPIHTCIISGHIPLVAYETDVKAPWAISLDEQYLFPTTGYFVGNGGEELGKSGEGLRYSGN